MAINFKHEAKIREESFLSDLCDLIRIKSDKDEDKITEDAPYGPGPLKALNYFLDYAEKDGFKTMNVGNRAGHLEYGEGEEVLGIFAHLDVVPAGNGWDTDPFEPVIKDGKLFARGSSDDKGPLLACYYGIKIIKDLNLPIKKKIRFIVGTDEESDWTDMEYYFEHSGLKKPDFGFSPDAEYPIINAEKGSNTIYLHFDGENDGDDVLVSFEAGLRENMVADTARAKITTSRSKDELVEKLDHFTKNQPISYVLDYTKTGVEITIQGKAAHAMSPFDGVNAATYLATFLSDLDFNQNASSYIETIKNYLHLDYYGEKFGVASESQNLGKLTMNPGVFSFHQSNNDNTIALDFRFPETTSPEEIMEQIRKETEIDTITNGKLGFFAPHYVPLEDPLVQTLLSVYEKQTGLEGYGQMMGGGTFGRLVDRGVAFGAMFPGYTNTMHKANEFVELEDLYRSIAIYAEAIYELVK